MAEGSPLTGLDRFAEEMRRRGRFGSCCICRRRRPAVSIALAVSDIKTVELRLCDHRCAYQLGMLTTEAIRSHASAPAFSQ